MERLSIVECTSYNLLKWSSFGIACNKQFTGCQWSNGSSSNCLYWSSSRCAAKPFRTSRMTASSSLTPDAVVCARPTPTLSLFRELTLGSEAGVFQWRDRKHGTVFPPHCENRTLNVCSSNDFQRHFCLARRFSSEVRF